MSADLGSVLMLDVRDNDGPVCLTLSAPQEESTGQNVAYEVVPDSVVARSSVLSSIAEAGTDAKLPDSVKLSDFKVWRDAIMGGTILGGRKFPDICTALKVADALGDKDIGEWLQDVATMVINRAIEHNHSYRRRSRCPTGTSDGSDTCDSTQELLSGLAALPEHLMLRLVEALTEDDLAKELAILLDVVPSQHHAAIVSTIIPPTKQLRIPSNNESLAFFKALAALPASLLSLTLDGHSLHSRRAALCEPQKSTPQEKVAAVVEVLHRHSGLTSLSLKTRALRDEATMPALAPAIAKLTALQSLHLSSHCSVDVEGMPKLKIALRRLSCLQSLILEIASPPKTPLQPSLKRARADNSAQAPKVSTSKRCLAGPLSTLTALTYLCITDDSKERRFKASVPLNMPHLKHLGIRSGVPNAVGVLLSKLSAPLSSLWFTDGHGSPWGVQDVPHAKQLWASLPKFDQLSSITLSLYACGDAAVLKKLWRGAPEALGALSSLQVLDISGDVPILSRVMQSLSSNGVGVRRMDFQCGRKRCDGAKSKSDDWRDLLGHLSGLTQLQRINMHAYGLGYKAPGLAALAPLTQLTALHVFAWWSVLNTEEDCKALAGMKELRSLFVDEFAVWPEYRLQTGLVRGLGALPHLTRLAMTPNWDRENDGEGYEAAFADVAARGAWPSLQWIHFYSFVEGAAEDQVRAVAGFPALKEVMLTDDPMTDSLSIQPGHRFYPQSVRARLDRIAADSAGGFKLTLAEREWSSRFY